ncbi:MAG TPA: neutral/alkaline non-lysosomal ceramidase N-terminal domain-containing protein [Candidatus Paceibacterota bacterium]|nr:neutral/alkaline non-lysosomal ceramidase N-terminal domain-containing protein [Verrucomicrobiota bacterium]HSA12019.1 neutral/alkaline non-lysosomal ceramidase N-terminal domain-containing protein [Candidatus Paceibacterota bacterium]
MNYITRKLLLYFLPALCLLVGCSHVNQTASPAPPLHVGAAEVDITPPVGYRMAGYFNERISTGIHDPLHAKAIVLQQGRQQVALVACDLIGVPLSVSTAARAQASQRSGIPAANIVICATHTHTGPLYEGPLREYFHEAALKKNQTDPQEKVDYAAFLTDRLVNVIAAAQATLRPAQLQAGIAKQEGLSFNRRFWMKNGTVVFNPGQLNPDIVRPAGPIDPDVGILLARGLDAAQPFAGLTVFAVHSDTVGGTEYSADYSYFLQQTLRGAFGQQFTSTLGLGTCGDLNHINVNEAPASRQKFQIAERIGDTLGRVVVEQSKQLPTLSKPALAARSAVVRVPFQQATPEEIAEARAVMEKFYDRDTPFLTKVAAVRTLDLARLSPRYPLEVQVFRLDAETAIVCLPCEIFVELGLAIKQASPFQRTMVIEICNDRPSYVPTLKAFGEGSYEVTNARVKPGAGEMLVDAAVKLLKEVRE